MDPRIADLVDPQDGTIGAFTFWLNETLYALSIRNVLSINQDNETISAVPRDASGLLGIVRYQGQPVTLFDFAARIGMKSGRETKEALIAQLTTLEEEYHDWFDTLEDSLQRDVPFNKSRDPKQSSFGRWFYSFRTREENLSEIVDQFRAPHEQVFEVAEEALSLRNQGRAEEGLAHLKALRPADLKKMTYLFSQTRQLLSELARPVILYVTEDGKNVNLALRIDDLNNIVNFGPEHFTPSSGDKNQIVLGCLCKEDEPDCLLINIDSMIQDTVVESHPA